MGKRQKQELRRLEEALMESDENPKLAKATSSHTAHAVYNTDETDVDLDAYSEDVYRGSHGNFLSGLLTMVIMIALSAGILLLLKILGVL